VSVALRRLDEHLHSGKAHEVLNDVERELNHPPESESQPTPTWTEPEHHDLNPT
jgi:hypothetical protein